MADVNPFDQFDEAPKRVVNPFDQFDEGSKKVNPFDETPTNIQKRKQPFNMKNQTDNFYKKMLNAKKPTNGPGLPHWKGDENPNPMNIDNNTEWLDVLGNGLTRVPSSSFGLLRDMVNAVTHPIDTMSGLAGLGAGLAMKAVPGKQPNEKYIDGLIQQMKARYGSIQGFKKAIGNDPVAILTDVATILIPAGKALGASKLTKVGTAVNPMNAPGKLLASTIKGPGSSTTPKLMQNIGKLPGINKVVKTIDNVRNPKKIMKDSLKFDENIKPNTVDKLVNKAIDEGLGRNTKSRNKLQKQIEIERKRVDEVIAKQGPETVIDTRKYGQKLDKDLKYDKSFGKDAKTFKDTVKDFEAESVYSVIKGPDGKRLPKQVTAQEAKKTLDALNKHLTDVKKKALNEPVKQNVRRSLRNGVVKTLNDAIPELKGINQNLDELVALKNALTEVTGNMKKDMLYSAVSTAGKAMATGGKSASFEFMRSVFQTPKVKVAMANLMNKLKSGGMELSPTKQAIALGLILPERIKEDDNIQP